MRVLMLGGTRFLGRRVARLLADAGAEVTLLHRGVTTGPLIPGTIAVHGDRSAPDGLDGVRGQRFHAVLDLSSYFSAWTQAALAALAGRAGHYVYVSSGVVYRPSPELPWPESAPLGPDPYWGRYAEEKLASEAMLWAAHNAGALPVTVFRLPFVLGPGNYADRESFVLSRLKAGRPILLPGGGSAVNQFVYVDDVARAIVAALERTDAAAGRAFNCAFGRGLTNRGFVELCADVMGLPARIVPVDPHQLGVAAETMDLSNLLFPFPERHYLLDPTRLARELGVEARTGNRRMIEEFASWWETQADQQPRRYEREERALQALGL